MNKIKQFVVPLTFIIIGLITVPWEGHQKWVWRGMILYSLPLLFYFSKSAKVREAGFIIGACVLFQAVISPFVLDKVFLKDYMTLKPNFHKVINVKEGSISGIKGDQAYTTDEKGFRVTRKINYEKKPANTLRIFAIGSSTVEGMLLGDQVNWPHLLQENLNSALSSKQVEVINTGISGTSARNHLATFRQILKYEPDIAIFLMGGNDWGHHIKVEQNPKEGLAKSLEQLGVSLPIELRENLMALRTASRFDNTIIAEIFRTVKAKFKKSTPRKEDTLYQKFAGGAITSLMGSLNKPDKRVFRPKNVSSIYQHFVSEMGELCKENTLICIFANQPTAYKENATDEIKAKFWVTPHNEDYTLDFKSMIHVSRMYNDFIISFALDNGFVPCDVSAGTPPTLDYFWDDIHFNVGGAKKAAEILLECVMQTINRSTP